MKTYTESARKLVANLKFACKCHNMQFGKIMTELGYIPKKIKAIENGHEKLPITDLVQIVRKCSIDVNEWNLTPDIKEVYHADIREFSWIKREKDVEEGSALLEKLKNTSDDITDIEGSKTYKKVMNTSNTKNMLEALHSRRKLYNIIDVLMKENNMKSHLEVSLLLSNSKTYLARLRLGMTSVNRQLTETLTDLFNLNEEESAYVDTVVRQAILTYGTATTTNNTRYVKRSMDEYTKDIPKTITPELQIFYHDLFSDTDKLDEGVEDFMNITTAITVKDAVKGDVVWNTLRVYVICNELARYFNYTKAAMSSYLFGDDAVIGRIGYGKLCPVENISNMFDKLHLKKSMEDPLAKLLFERIIEAATGRKKDTLNMLFHVREAGHAFVSRPVPVTAEPQVAEEKVEPEPIKVVGEVVDAEDDDFEYDDEEVIEENISEYSNKGVVNNNWKFTSHGVKDINNLKTKFKPELTADVAHARNRVGQIISQLAMVNNLTLSQFADRIGVEPDELQKICAGKYGISIYHAIRIEDQFNMSSNLKHDFEKYAFESEYSEIPEYVKKYIQNATIAKVLAKCAESNMPAQHFETLLKYCK